MLITWLLPSHLNQPILFSEIIHSCFITVASCTYTHATAQLAPSATNSLRHAQGTVSLQLQVRHTLLDLTVYIYISAVHVYAATRTRTKAAPVAVHASASSADAPTRRVRSMGRRCAAVRSPDRSEPRGAFATTLSTAAPAGRPPLQAPARGQLLAMNDTCVKGTTMYGGAAAHDARIKSGIMPVNQPGITPSPYGHQPQHP